MATTTTTYDTGDEIRADDFDPLFTDTSVEDDQDIDIEETHCPQPVAWMDKQQGAFSFMGDGKYGPTWTPLYLAAPQVQPESATEDFNGEPVPYDDNKEE